MIHFKEPDLNNLSSDDYIFKDTKYEGMKFVRESGWDDYDRTYASPVFSFENGDRVVFEDMAHYTTVKTTMFNGVTHPSMVLVYSNGQMDLLRKFTYQDYKKRMS